MTGPDLYHPLGLDSTARSASSAVVILTTSERPFAPFARTAHTIWAGVVCSVSFIALLLRRISLCAAYTCLMTGCCIAENHWHDRVLQACHSTLFSAPWRNKEILRSWRGTKKIPLREGENLDQNTLSQSSDISELSHIETGRIGWFSWSPTEYGSRLSVSCWLRFGPSLRAWSIWLAAIRSNCSRGISGLVMVCSG